MATRIAIVAAVLAVGALALGAGTALVGLVIPRLRSLYDYSWLIGFTVAFIAYYALMLSQRRIAMSTVEA